MTRDLRTILRRARRRAVLIALPLLLAVAAGSGAGCDRGAAQAGERGAGSAVTSPAAPRTDGRQALRDGRALQKIDRLFSTPLGTKVN